MLKELLSKKYIEEPQLNCAQKILYSSNDAYNLGLDSEALKLVAGFGGGMAIESVCGALTGGIMVLGKLFHPSNVEEKERLAQITKDFFEVYKNEMGEINCAPLKDKYRTEETKCNDVIIKAAEVLETIIEKNRKNI